MDDLTNQRNQAQASAASLHSQASQRSAAAAQSQAQVTAADHDVATANAAAALIRQQATQLGTQKNAIAQQIATINRWQQEIARQPVNRAALETAAREIFAQITPLEDEYKSYADQANAAGKKQWYLQTLIQELNSKIGDVQGQLGSANTEVTQATAALNDVSTRIQHVLQRKPE